MTKTFIFRFILSCIIILVVASCVPQPPILQSTPTATTTHAPTSTVTTTPTPNIVYVTPAPLDSSDLIPEAVPTIGAQLNFSSDDSLESYEFRRSPFDGIFMSPVADVRLAPSWFALYPDESYLPAESDICIMNMSTEFFPAVQSGPLNVKVSRLAFDFAIYVNYKYTLEVKDIDIIIASFEPMNPNIEMVHVGQPGAGGRGYPFKTVQGMKVWVEGIPNTVYKMDFTDFILGPTNGVEIILPIAMSDAGSYQFIIKVNGVATPTFAGDPAGKISLTSNVIDYSWVKLNNPTDYRVNKIKGKDGELFDLELIPCP